MILEDHLVEQFAQLGLQLQPGLDTTADGTYLVYRYDSDGALFGDDGPCLDHRQWVIIFVCPAAEDHREDRAIIRQTIQKLFGVLPSEDDATDGSKQKYIYNFETFGGILGGSI